MKIFLINQFAVKVQKINIAGSRNIYLAGAAMHWGHRGCGKYRDSGNLKAVPRINSGVEIAPVPILGFFSPAAGLCSVDGPLWRR